LSVAYVPDQCFTSPVSPEKALEMGTAWNELYRPYKGGRM
ncbi:MAG: spore coat associated protein CotJA, partial [Clostridia bacterium]|nr:spore coat associated protein CotJA [Clostridia bacterium]